MKELLTIRIQKDVLNQYKKLCQAYSISYGVMTELLITVALDKANRTDNLIFSLKEEIQNKELLQ